MFMTEVSTQTGVECADSPIRIYTLNHLLCCSCSSRLRPIHSNGYFTKLNYILKRLLTNNVFVYRKLVFKFFIEIVTVSNIY